MLPGWDEVGPISPELVLVDPDLARVARQLLPDRHDWTIDFEPRSVIAEGRVSDESLQITERRAPALARSLRIGVTLMFMIPLAAILAVPVLRPASSRPHLTAPTTPEPAGPPARTQTRTAPDRAPGSPSSRSHLSKRRAHGRKATVTRPPGAKPAPPREGIPAAGKNAASAGQSVSPGKPVVESVIRRAKGHGAGWAIARLGRPTSSVRQGSTCWMRWSPLNLTLIVAVPESRTPCQEGKIVASRRGYVPAR